MNRTRREFLRASLGGSALLSLTQTVPTWLSRTAMAAERDREAGGTVLVVIQLSGGNDGLNTVVPYADDEYAKSRPTLRLPTNGLHKIDSLLGFHPRTESLLRLYKEGHLGIVQGVGYPNTNGDHAIAMRAWQTAMPEDPNCQTGWLGRVVDGFHDENEATPPAVFVGQTGRPFTLNAEKAIVAAVGSLEECTVRTLSGAGAADRAHRRSVEQLAESHRPSEDGPLLDFLRRTTLSACADSRKIEAVIADPAPSNAAEYPRFALAQMFRVVAQLIRADVGIRVYHTELGGEGFGGFDNHANQLGNHGALLHQLSESLAAFVDDLQGDSTLDRVLVMTFSEFGRTVKENGRRGTDHGAAAPVFLAGGKIKGGLTGEHPKLTELQNGGLKFHTDFRRLYATVLDRWLGFDSRAVLGEPFEPLDVLEV